MSQRSDTPRHSPHRHPTRRERWISASNHQRDGKRSSAGDALHLLSERDEVLVRAVARFHFLTAEQLTCLFYRPASLAYVREKLRRLTQAGALLRLRLPQRSAGNPPFVYTLARGGLRFLAHSGDPSPVRFRPAEHREHAYLLLSHTLAVNDVLIAATRASQEAPEIVLVDLQHERDLRHTPTRVTTAQGEHMSVVPDAWLDLHVGGKQRMCLVLELDRGTIEQRAMKRKLRGLLAYAGGPYQEEFGTSSLTILLATTAGKRRERQLRQWCEQILAQQRLQAEADLFLITDLPPGAISPTTFFRSPIWWQPFGQSPQALALPPAEGSGA